MTRRRFACGRCSEVAARVHELAASWIATWVLVLAMLTSTNASADDTLRLSEFVAEVEAENPNVKAAKLRTKAARERVGPARALPDPFVAVGVDEIALGRQEMDDGSRMWPRPVLRYQVNQTIPVGAKRRARSDVAQANAEITAASVEVTKRTLRVAAAQLFLQALYVQRALDTNAKLGRTLEDVLAAAEARYRTGGTGHHEILLARAERAVLRRDALVLRRTLAVLHAEMNELRGRPADRTPPRLVDDAGKPLSSLSFGAAIARQPELLGAGEVVAAAVVRERVAKTSGYPDVSLQVMAMQSLTPGMPSNAGAMVGVSVPIFWGRKQVPGIRAARQERKAADQDREALRRRLEAEWTAAKTAHDTSLDTVTLYEREVLPDLQAALESATAGYVTQKVTLLELLTVVRSTLTAELEHEAARIDVRLARLRLDELLSMPSIVRLAPASPTLLGGSMGGAMPTMTPMSSGPGGGPIRMGTGMQPPPVLDTGEGAQGGMEGMR